MDMYCSVDYHVCGFLDACDLALRDKRAGRSVLFLPFTWLFFCSWRLTTLHTWQATLF